MFVVSESLTHIDYYCKKKELSELFFEYDCNMGHTQATSSVKNDADCASGLENMSCRKLMQNVCGPLPFKRVFTAVYRLFISCETHLSFQSSSK